MTMDELALGFTAAKLFGLVAGVFVGAYGRRAHIGIRDGRERHMVQGRPYGLHIPRTLEARPQ